MAKNEPIKKTKKHLARQQREARQTRIILTITAVIGAIILALVGYGLVDSLIVKPRTPVARVGEETIRVNDFQPQVQYTRIQMLNQAYQYYNYALQFGEYGQSFLDTSQNIASQLMQPDIVGRDVLDQMIEDILIREEAAKRGITVSEEEIDERLYSAFGFFPDGTPTPTQTATILATPTLSETQYALISPTPSATSTDIPTETPEVTATPSDEEEVIQETEEAEETPEATATEAVPQETATPASSPTITLTPTPFTTEVYAQNIDEFNDFYSTYKFDINDLREIIEADILREKLAEEMGSDIEPFKEEVWARHILVETEKEAEVVLEQLDEGEDFASLAAGFSTDESNKDMGGDLGWFDRNTMVTEFSDAAFELEIGEISDPVETSFGFHIIQVLGKRESQILPSELSQMKQEMLSEWLTEQRNAREDVVVYDAWEKYTPSTPEIPQQFIQELFLQNTTPSLEQPAP